MPIHLPPLTRRDFLRRSLLAGAALTLGRDRLFAETPAFDAHTWALLSDPHISADPALRNGGVAMYENLKAVVSEIGALASRPSRMLINGDCAKYNGEPGDYANFFYLLEPIREAGLPIDLTIGNHDDRTHFLASVPGENGKTSPVPDRYVSMVDTPRANWFLLDSLEEVAKTPGVLGPAQLKWLAKELDSNASKPAIVCAHHTPDDPAKGGSGLRDINALLAVLAPRRHVKAFMFGHSHRWNLTEHEGIHMINLPAVSYVYDAKQPTGWVHALVEENGLRLQLYALDKGHPENGKVKQLAWRT